MTSLEPLSMLKMERRNISCTAN